MNCGYETDINACRLFCLSTHMGNSLMFTGDEKKAETENRKNWQEKSVKYVRE